MIRIGKNKVRTGCYTCKRRRVKCDEARPSCNRCIKAGKVCEGYANDPGSVRNDPIRFVVYAPHNPGPVLSEHPDLDWPEQRALSYFQDRTALELAGSFNNDFWMRHILPIARQERSVRHAIIALSSMHEHYSGVDHYSPTKGVDFALEHYGRAMREVVRFRQSDPNQSFEFALVTSALFSTFESLQGQYHEACNHAVAGIKILAEEQRRRAKNQLHTRIPREHLTRFFIALGRQIFELGDPNFPDDARPELYYTRRTFTLPPLFTSYEDALLHMEMLLGELFDYVEKAEEAAKQGSISEDVGLSLMTEFHSIKLHFDRWRSTFQTFAASDMNEFSRETPESVSSSSSAASSPTGEQHHLSRSPAFLILKVYYSIATSFLKRIEVNDEAVFNDFVPDLWSALDAAEEFIQCTSTYVNPLDKTSPSRSPLHPTISASNPPLPPVVRPTFSLALGIVPVVFLIASRASDPAVRDKAASLLRTCNRREGFWDSNLASALIDRIFELRELAAHIQVPPDAPLDLTAIRAELPRVAAKHNHTAPPGTVLSHNSGESPSPNSNGIGFKLLDIKFLPGRKCTMRYTFIRESGEKVFDPQIPAISDHSRLVPATRRYQGEFWEEVGWQER